MASKKTKTKSKKSTKKSVKKIDLTKGGLVPEEKEEQKQNEEVTAKESFKETNDFNEALSTLRKSKKIPVGASDVSTVNYEKTQENANNTDDSNQVEVSKQEVSSPSEITDERYAQLNRVALGYGLKKAQLVELFQKELGAGVRVMPNTQNHYQVAFEFAGRRFPETGHYSCKR